jgi:hypothetical protein
MLKILPRIIYVLLFITVFLLYPAAGIADRNGLIIPVPADDLLSSEFILVQDNKLPYTEKSEQITPAVIPVTEVTQIPETAITPAPSLHKVQWASPTPVKKQ